MNPETFLAHKPDALHAYRLIAAIPPAQQFDPFAKVYTNAAWDAEIARCDAHNAQRAAQIAETAQTIAERWPDGDRRAGLLYEILRAPGCDWDLERTALAVFEAAAELAEAGA